MRRCEGDDGVDRRFGLSAVSTAHVTPRGHLKPRFLLGCVNHSSPLPNTTITTKPPSALQCVHRSSLTTMDGNRPRPGGSASAVPANAAQPARSEASNPPAPSNAPKVQQPKPQALPSRSGPSSILVSPRQKGNPILNSVRSVAWEYSDIPADYVVGATTCALFLSLKYHRLHPEYIYNRIRDLKGQ